MLTYCNGVGRRALDGLKFAAASFAFAFIASCVFVDTVTLVAPLWGAERRTKGQRLLFADGDSAERNYALDKTSHFL
jgi:hypothetical protein